MQFTSAKQVKARGNIHGQAMTFLLHENLSKRTGKVGLDLGAGTLAVRPYFNVQRYIGVEVHEPSFNTARMINPDAEIYLSSIQDFKPDVPIDIAVCHFVLGNARFNQDDIVPTVKRVVSWLAPGGSFFFDIRRSVRHLESEVDAALDGQFGSITKRTFGRFRLSAPAFIQMPIAKAIYKSDILTKPILKKNQSTSYACWDKL